MARIGAEIDEPFEPTFFFFGGVGDGAFKKCHYYHCLCHYCNKDNIAYTFCRVKLNNMQTLSTYCNQQLGLMITSHRSGSPVNNLLADFHEYQKRSTISYALSKSKARS